MTRIVTALALSLVVATSSLALAEPASPPPVPSDNVRTPLIVKWKAAELAKGSLRIVAHVERMTSFAAPLTVSVILPKGARLVSGPASFQVAAGTAAGVDDRSLEVRFDNVPSDDLQLVADIQTSSFGAHARDAYRFGRAAPQMPVPTHEGPVVRVGDQTLGRAVMMPPPAKK